MIIVTSKRIIWRKNLAPVIFHMYVVNDKEMYSIAKKLLMSFRGNKRSEGSKLF